MVNIWEDNGGCDLGLKLGEEDWEGLLREYKLALKVQEEDSGNLLQGYRQAMGDEKWLAATDREYKSLMENETWDLVELPEGRRAFPSKRVFSWRCGMKQGEDERRGEEIVREKARLVARGDLQTPGVNFKKTFAPVVKFVTFWVFLVFAAINDLHIKHWDVLSAFLQGAINMDLFMKQPPGYDDNSGKVCKLKKLIYGLCQSVRLFYLKLDSVLGELDFQRTSADWAIWVHKTRKAVLVCHVDDISIAGPGDFLSEIREHRQGMSDEIEQRAKRRDASHIIKLHT